MPVRGRGTFPDAPATFRDDGSEAVAGSSRAAARPHIAEYRAMKKLPRYQHALDILRRVGGIVQPIMALRGWHLPLLVEIYPDKDNLLGFNVNAGRKIALRLRRPHDKDDFIDEESIVETMLHELAHNLHGPHDEIFYKHLDKLTEEWQQLRTGGWLPGQGFMVGGKALGGSSSSRLPPRDQARQSAEGRSRNAARGGGAHVLGGSTPLSEAGLLQQLTPREAALVAAERRRVIANACPSNDAASTQEAAQEQEDDEVVHGVAVITIRDDDDENGSSNDIEIIEGISTIGKRRKVNDAASTSKSAPNGAIKESVAVDDDDDDDFVVVDVKKQAPRRSPRRPTPTSAQPARAIQQMQAAAALRSGLMASSDERGSVRGALAPQASSSTTAIRSTRMWTCQACTLANRPDALQCSACETVRPGVPSWSCLGCGHVMLGEEQASFWCCKVCGRVKVA